MNTYEAAERLARAIHTQGWSCLSISEERVLQDPEFRGIVDTLISKLNRAELLQGTSGSKTRLTPIDDENSKCIGSVDWETPEIARRGQLWVHSVTQNAIMEIKEWSIGDYYGAINMGAHELIFQRRLEYSTRDELLARVKTILVQHGCPEQKAKDFSSNLYL